MKITVRIGDLTETPADAICTSTNPRLSLMMGTGGAVREKGGFEVLRECEQIVEAEQKAGRKYLRTGSVHTTTAGKLPYKLIIHCVASDATHQSSADVVRACIRNALARADAAGCRIVAMPVFATGHAHLGFGRSLAAMAAALREAATSVEEVIVVVNDPKREEELLRAFDRAGSTS